MTGTEIEKDTLVEEDVIFESIDSVLEISLQTKENYNYEIEIYDNVSSVQIEVAVQFYSTLSPSTTFGCKFPGYKVVDGYPTISIASGSIISSTPITFSYRIIEYPPLDTALNGTWILTSKSASAFGMTTEDTYSHENVDEIIHIQNDSIYTYNSLNEGGGFGGLFIDSWKQEFRYNIDGEQLELNQSNEYGNVILTYEKYYGELDNPQDIKWLKQSYEPYVGLWYLSHEHRRFLTAAGIDTTITNSYNSGTESNFIVKVSQDSTTVYSNFWGTDSNTLSNEDYIQFFNKLNASETQLSKHYSDFWYSGIQWNPIIIKSTYTPFTGEFPFAEWDSVEIPSEQIELSVGETFTKTVAKYDTVCFSVNLTYGMSYTFESFIISNYLNLVLFDSNMNRIERFFSWEEFTYTPQQSGTYYIVAQVGYTYDKETSDMSIRVDTWDDYSRSSEKSSSVRYPLEEMFGFPFRY